MLKASCDKTTLVPFLSAIILYARKRSHTAKPDRLVLNHIKMPNLRPSKSGSFHLWLIYAGSVHRCRRTISLT